LLRIVFWNVNRSDLTELVCSLTKSTQADIIILNENSVPSEETLTKLCKEVSKDFYIPPQSSNDRFHCFCRNRNLDFSQVHSGFRISVHQLNLISQPNILFAMVHGVDIQNYDTEERQSFAQSLATEFEFVRSNHSTNRLIAMGDFNMNPFDRGMNLAAGLNAMMTKKCVEAGKRQHLGKDYELYYNPMWSLLGDMSAGPPGTIYDTSRRGSYGWSMLDQVILSHSTIDLFESVEILTSTGQHPLIKKNGRPNSAIASDHLPIMLTLREVSDE
jgi:exonuclease III